MVEIKQADNHSLYSLLTPTLFLWQLKAQETLDEPHCSGLVKLAISLIDQAHSPNNPIPFILRSPLYFLRNEITLSCPARPLEQHDEVS